MKSRSKTAVLVAMAVALVVPTVALVMPTVALVAPASAREHLGYASAADPGEAAHLAASGGTVARDGEQLHIKTDAGLVSLRDDASDLSEEYRVYRYEGILSGTDFHAVHVSYFETPGYLLVHRSSGRQFPVDARPLLSPSTRRLAVASFDLEAMMAPNVLVLYELSGDSLLALWTDEPLDWGPEALRWVADDTLEVVCAFLSDRGPGEYDRRRDRLVRTATGWGWLEAAEE